MVGNGPWETLARNCNCGKESGNNVGDIFTISQPAVLHIGIDCFTPMTRAPCRKLSYGCITLCRVLKIIISLSSSKKGMVTGFRLVSPRILHNHLK